MNESDLRRLEKELKLTLPASYRTIVSNFPDELRHWPDRPESGSPDRRDDFLLDVKQLLKANQRVRKKLKKEFPAKGFVIGGSGDEWWLINAGSKNPSVELVQEDYILDGFDDLADLFATVPAPHKEAWAKAKKRTSAASKASLAPADLIAEGRRLARPAVALYDKGSKYAALWRGTGVVPPGAGKWRHWISIDTRFLPQNPRRLKGVVSLYDWFADDDRFGELQVVHDPKAALPAKGDGKRLFARNIECMPYVDAVFEFGSKPVKDWVQSGAWEPNTGYDKSPV